MNSAPFVERRSAPRPFALKITQIILATCGIVFGLGLGLTAASVWTSQEFSVASRQSIAMMDSMREHMTADMLHDGLRGVVFRQMYASMTFNQQMVKEGLAEVDEYSGQFRAALAAQGQLSLPPSVTAALGKVSEPLDLYIGEAHEIVQLAAEARLKEAQDRLAAFDESFKALEGAMSDVSDAIEAANRDVIVAAEGASTHAAMINFAGLALTTLLSVGLLGFGRRFLSGPLVRLTAVMRELANGRLNEVPSSIQRVHEIAAMQGVVSTYSNALVDRNHLAQESERTTEEMKRRSAETSALNDEFSRVVQAALQGDFSGRIEGSYGDDSLVALASGFNELVGSVDRVVVEAGSALSALAEADLTKRVTGNYAGALARLRNDTNAVAEKFTHIVEQLQLTSGQLRTATGEILAGANDLAERTTKQAAAIEETSAAMEQLSTTVVENAKRAEQASSKAQNVSDTAALTGEVMTKSNAAMDRISSSSAKISNIIGLIDDIAFQTNLLALNASVEAARAGDAGKGFAVVAVEVRRLAQSAASASSEVKVLIEQSAGEVSSGSKLVAEATQKLVDMLVSVKESAELIKDISSASREQSSAIAEVSTAIRQMDEMTQHNAALVEQTNAAIEQTEAQANELDQIVDRFVIDAAQSRAAAPVQAARPAAATGIKALQQKVKAA